MFSFSYITRSGLLSIGISLWSYGNFALIKAPYSQKKKRESRYEDISANINGECQIEQFRNGVSQSLSAKYHVVYRSIYLYKQVRKDGVLDINNMTM